MRFIPLVLAVLLLMANVLYYASNTTRVALFYVSGRHSMCSFRQAAADMRRDDVREEFHTVSREFAILVRQDRGLSLYRLADGSLWWFPPRGRPYAGAGLGIQRWAAIPGLTPVRDGEVFLDCGAYNGDSTKSALRMGAKLVVAIEPSPAAVECLRRNLKAEIEAGQVIVYPKGVWDREELVRLKEHDSKAGADTVVGNGSGPLVPLTTIDRLVQELQLEKVDFIKMDIEGAEQNALRGATETIRRFRPRLSIAGYHLSNDHEVIPQIVNSIRPDYRLRCGRCGIYYFKVIPALLYFY